METNNVENLLDWLKVQPRTLGWGAVMAYGRSETNKVLLQEYIERFSTSNYLRPITKEITDNTTPTQKEFLHNYQMDAPRLSFQGSTLQKSAAKLTMQVVGGSHLTFSKPAGFPQWSVTKIAQEDVLDGPQLLFDIDLLAATGSVTSAGRVELDISKGTNYRLTYVQTEHLRKVAGQRMQEIFRPLPDDQKIFVLNELKFEPDQFLKPDKFVIRTHNKKDSGAALLAGEDEGEGSVLVFVAMQGDANGTLPVDNADLKYLLPDGHSATVILKDEIVKQKVMIEGMQGVNQYPEEFKFTDIIQDEIFYGIRGRSGGLKVPLGVVSTPRFDIDIPFVYMDFYNPGIPDFPFPFDAHFSFVTPGYRYTFTDPDFYIKYCCLLVVGVKNIQSTVTKLNGQAVSMAGVFGLGYSTSLGFDLVIENGQLIFRPRPVDPELDEAYEVHPGEVFSEIEAVREDLSLIVPEIKIALRSAVHAAYEKFSSSLPVFDIFTLNSLLFRGGNSINLEVAHIPRDMALFGHVGPTQTAFAITQLEPVIGHSETLQFAIEPPRTGLTWKVENILGETVPVGAINASSGRYTAPTAAQLQGSFVRVRVTASAGGHTSSALVTVMRRGITVNPMIQIATAGDPMALDVSAGAVDGGELTWSIEDPSSGAVVRPNPAEGGDHSYVPGSPQAGKAPTVDTLVVHNPRTKLSETARVMVLHRPALLSVVVVDKPGLPEHQIQLAIMGEDGPIDPGSWKESWQVLLGSESAQINATTGLLTVNPAGPDKFVAITVLAPPARPGGADDDGYIILPLPLFSVPETLRMLGANGQ